jgi:F-type H+-transporting ATPase subunit b
MIKAASKKAQQRSDEIISDAKSEASAILAKAGEDVEREKKRAQNELRGEISELAVLVAQQVVEKEITEADHERFINDFIENVGDLK